MRDVDASNLTTREIQDPAELDPHLDAWDALAVEADRPFCAPGWMLSWWNHAREDNARLRVVLVFEGERLVGVGPFFARMRSLGIAEMRLLAAGFCHRIGPLAKAGREEEVAAALVGALTKMDPYPASVVLEGIDAEDRWAELIAAAWPGKRTPGIRDDRLMDSLVIELGASYESWLASKSKNFRDQARRRGRRLADEGAEPRIAHDADAATELMRLHHDRWDDRGGSGVAEGAAQMIAEAGRRLPEGRLQIALLDRDDAPPVAAQLLVTAGSVSAYWGGGFDASLSKWAPGNQALLAGFESVAELGVTTIDLGGGEQDYKRRFTDEHRPLAWRTVYPPGWRKLVLRAMLAPKHARQTAAARFRRLSPEHQRKIRKLLRR